MHVQDDGGIANGGVVNSSMHVMEIRILPINTAPSFALLMPEALVCYDNPVFDKLVAVNISVEPFEDQNVTFLVDLIRGDASVFDKFPKVTTDGRLDFKIANTSSGEAVLNITLLDNGGNVRGGNNRSASHAFTIKVEEFLIHSLSTVAYIVDEDSTGNLQLLVSAKSPQQSF